ncbi:MAG: potassium transporter TrkG, partial [Halobacteriales archaeon]
LGGVLEGQLEPAIRHAAFQSVSIVTTTGYATFDFNAWGPAPQYLLLAAMFVGGSAGSTGGSVKVIRWLVVVKSIRRELFTTVHPDAVTPVRLGPIVVDERAIRGIYAFTGLYVVLFFLATGLVAIDAARVGLEATPFELMSAVAATLGNVGPGFGIVGPMENYGSFPPTTKLLMVFLMWAGRLEILTVFVLLTPAYWRS